MVRRLLILIVLAALPASAATRWFTEREGGPVKWMEWGPAAIERAKNEKRQILLSIGFASSWDALRMHREAFSDERNVKTLNAYFVPVLLDRIEYPEIAEAYERVEGGSGFPVNVILGANLEPIAAGGFMDADELQRFLVTTAERPALKPLEPRSPFDIDASTMEAVVDAIGAKYAQEKTLDPLTAAFLLRYSARMNHAPLRELAISSLRARAASAVRDQLGGGFHRCIGCFEKLLGEQAVNALVYLDAARMTGDKDLEFVARTTLDYVLRDLRMKPGAFEASQDAHSLVPRNGGPEYVDGAFYRWNREEISNLLRDDAGKVFSLYGLAEKDALPVLSDPRFLHETRDELAPLLQKLMSIQQRRPEPFREQLVVAGWNGLMISALARFNEVEYVTAASHAATDTLAKLWNAKTKTLLRTDSRVPALAEDYAYLVQGLLDLFDASYDAKWLDAARALQARQDELFWDASAGRYRTGTTLPDAMRGMILESDETLPSVNATAAVNLMRLAALARTSDERPAMIFQSFGGRLRNDGARLPQLAYAYELSLLTPRVVVVTGDPRKEPTQQLLVDIRAKYDPMRAIVFLPHKGAPRERIVKSLPWTAALAPDPELPLAYTCAGSECRK
jgi:uncharacterized protein YyaL (SSP411 family)